MKKIAFGTVVITALAITNPTTAQAAYTVKPSVGQCFKHTNAQVSAPYASVNPISCTKAHNAEIFNLTKWPVSTPPEKMKDADKLAIADLACNAFTEAGDGLLDGTDFNYWAWYTPDPKAWAKGQRWLRCDAMIIKNSKEPYIYISWQGSRLDAGINA